MADSLRVPPHSGEAETSVLGALLLDKDAVIAVAEFLHPDDFYDERHKQIYEAILSLFEERVPVDVLTVTERLKKKKTLKNVGGATYLSQLANRVPTAAHVEHYGKIVKDTATKRLLMNAATRLVDFSMDEGLSSADLMDKAETEVFAISQKNISKAFTSVKDTLAESFDRLDELHKQGEGLRGVPTGFGDLDNALAGMQKSNLLILAARPGVGKTAMSLGFAQHVAVKAKRPVGYFSLEMSKEELVDRLLVAQADIDAWKLKTGKLSEDDFTKLSNAMGELAEAPLYIDDTPALSILDMRTKARRLQVDTGVDLLIVDYLQLAKSRNLENRVNEVGEISQGLKNLARELKVPVLAVSQLSRGVESRGVKRPQLSDLRESGCLLGDSKIVDADTGKLIEIEKVVGRKNFNTIAIDEDLKLVKTKVSKIFPSGRKIVYKLTLKSGREIIASKNHPFLKLSGWTRLDKLEIGDRLATPKELKIRPRSKMNISDNKLIVLAHLLGDGCFVKRQSIHYTNSDMLLINIVKKAATKEFGIKSRLVQQQSWWHLYLTSKERLIHGKRNPIAKWLDEELGIYGLKSREKYIPRQIFSLDDTKIKFFLKHLWSTDGCIHLGEGSKKRKASLYYASGSKLLAYNVFYLLLRLGIRSVITKLKKRGYQDIYNVVIQGKVDQFKYLQNIGFVSKKKETASKVMKFLKSIESNPNNDVIPKEIWETIEELRRKKGLTTRDFHKRVGWAYSGTQRHKNGISRERLKKILKVISSKFLINLANSDIYWDEVKNIEKIGSRKVYDATVPKYANFIAENIIVHNSIEQDADVVMFLWREDDEKLENVMLDIAKHRNGPLASVPLFFKGDRIKFYPRDTKH